MDHCCCPDGGPRHRFDEALDRPLAEGGFDRVSEDACAPYDQSGRTPGRPSVRPGAYLRMLRLLELVVDIVAQPGLLSGRAAAIDRAFWWGACSRRDEGGRDVLHPMQRRLSQGVALGSPSISLHSTR